MPLVAHWKYGLIEVPTAQPSHPNNVLRINKSLWIPISFHDILGTLLLRKFTGLLAWIINHIHCFLWDVITHVLVLRPMEVRTWISKCIPIFSCVMLTCPWHNPDSGIVSRCEYKRLPLKNIIAYQSYDIFHFHILWKFYIFNFETKFCKSWYFTTSTIISDKIKQFFVLLT